MPAAADGQPVGGFGVAGVVIDSSFSGGNNVVPQQVVELRDGSFIVSGLLVPNGQQIAQQFVARYSATGTLDRSFDGDGVIIPSPGIGDLTPLPDGRVMVTASSAVGGLAILNLDGSITPLPLRLLPWQLIARSDGATYALGDATRGDHVVTVVRPDGAIDARYDGNIGPLLPTGSHMGVSNVAFSPPNGTVLSDGRLVVGFAFTAPQPAQPSCGIVAFDPDGRPDLTFGSNGLLSLPQTVCLVSHVVDDTIRVVGDVGDPVVTVSRDGVRLGPATAPFDARDLLLEGTGAMYSQTGSNKITRFDRLGHPDTTFGTNGVATLPGMTIDGFSLLESGDVVAWGNAAGNTTALALGRIHGSFGTALQPPAVRTTKFVPMAPARILDTRSGLGAPRGIVAPGGHVDVQIAGVAGVPPSGIAAVVLNVTATEGVNAGYVSAYPSATRQPSVSSLNLEAPGQTVANLVTVKVGVDGKVTLFTSGGGHLIADITGYYTPATSSTDGRLRTAAPERVLDTRSGLGGPLGSVAVGGHVDLRVTGAGSVPGSGVAAVVLNVTADQAAADGFVTVWPTGADRPVVSNLNLVAGETRANLVVVRVGVGGQVSLYTSGGADLIADVAGWFTDSTAPLGTAGLFVPMTPTRIFDSRQETAPPTKPASSLTRRIGSTATVPPGAAAVASNVTVTQSAGPGFVTAWPAGTTRPEVSNLNTVRGGQTIANAVVAPLGAEDVALFTQSGAHLIVDIDGWYTRG